MKNTVFPHKFWRPFLDCMPQLFFRPQYVWFPVHLKGHLIPLCYETLVVNWQNWLFTLFHQSRSVLSPNPIGNFNRIYIYIYIYTYVYIIYIHFGFFRALTKHPHMHGWPITQPGTCTQPCPIVHTAVPPLFTQPCPGRTMPTALCVYLRCRAVCKLPGYVEGHPWYVPWHTEQRAPVTTDFVCTIFPYESIEQ